MTRFAWMIVTWGCLWLVMAVPCRAVEEGAAEEEAAGKGAFDGEWAARRSGAVKLKQAGNLVTGAYGNARQFTLKGTVEGRKLAFEYQEGQARGDADWTLDESGHSFRGGFKLHSGQTGVWQGWRPDPEAPRGKTLQPRRPLAHRSRPDGTGTV